MRQKVDFPGFYCVALSAFQRINRLGDDHTAKNSAERESTVLLCLAGAGVL